MGLQRKEMISHALEIAAPDFVGVGCAKDRLDIIFTSDRREDDEYVLISEVS
jgi:hypothetical protein